MNNTYRRKNLYYLDIVSEVWDEIGILEIIDKILPPDRNRKVSHGECITYLAHSL